MPRQPKLRKQTVRGTVCWFTKAGGTCFGAVDAFPCQDARMLFKDHVQSLLDERKDSKQKGFTGSALLDHFLEQEEKHHSDQTCTTGRNYCSRFGGFTVGGTRSANLPANRVKGTDLEAVLERMKAGKSDARRSAKFSDMPRGAGEAHQAGRRAAGW